MSSMLWKNRLKEISQLGLARRMKTIGASQGPIVETNDGPKLMFCSNNYLGLASDPRITNVISDAVKRLGSGSGGSRLISGNSEAHTHLEIEIAEFLRTESAVLFTSGYQANVGALSSLLGAGDHIFSDELVHASLIDGCRLSKARTHIYRHGDSEHLETLLKRYRGNGVNLIVTDAVFSMDGDRAPLLKLIEVGDRFGAELYVDEAHSFGVVGDAGRGLCEELGVADRVAIRMGTFGKALGIFGAFIAADANVIDLLTSGARSLLYTTAVPAAIMEGIRVALRLTGEADALRMRLNDNIAFFRESAEDHGLPVLYSDTAIQPVAIGQSDKTMMVSNMLWDAGVFVQGIRPPTVAEGSSRLRITLSASHEIKHIEQLVNTLSDILEKMNR